MKLIFWEEDEGNCEGVDGEDADMISMPTSIL
jgi:hypothetical protein